MSCKISFLKGLMVVFNTVLSLLGIGLIALSVYELNTSTPGTIERIAIVVQIFIGSFVILTSFLGCFSLCRESLGLIWSYAICVLILLVFQIYIIIAAHSTNYKQNATDDFEALWSNFTMNMARISETEQRYNCCGIKSGQDYRNRNQTLPNSCYPDFERKAGQFTDGCLEVLQRTAVTSGHTGLAIKWTLFFIELFTLGFTALLAITIRNKQRRQEFRN